MAIVNAEGQLGLLCNGMTASHLQLLAQWTRDHLEEYPELARLRGAHILPVGAEGGVDSPITQHDSWLKVPDRPPRGTVAHAEALIDGLAPGDKAWVWMIQCGPFGVPILCLSRCDDDPKMRSLQICVKTLMQGRRIPSPTARGLLRRGGTGGLSVLSTGDRDPMRAIIQTLLEHYDGALTSLRGVVVLSMGGGAASALAPEQTVIDSTAAATGAILSQPGFQKTWFFFGTDALNAPFLMLGEHKKSLSAAAQRIRGKGPKARGQLRLTSTGRLDFRTRDDVDDFIEGVADWVRRHQREVPALQRLHGARLLLIDDEGLIRTSRKNDAAWGPGNA
jgi:hypothetical protein